MAMLLVSEEIVENFAQEPPDSVGQVIEDLDDIVADVDAGVGGILSVKERLIELRERLEALEAQRVQREAEAITRALADKMYRFHWVGGKTQDGPGRDGADAARRLGIGRGALRVLDYVEELDAQA